MTIVSRNPCLQSLHRPLSGSQRPSLQFESQDKVRDISHETQLDNKHTLYHYKYVGNGNFYSVLFLLDRRNYNPWDNTLYSLCSKVHDHTRNIVRYFVTSIGSPEFGTRDITEFTSVVHQALRAQPADLVTSIMGQRRLQSFICTEATSYKINTSIQISFSKNSTNL